MSRVVVNEIEAKVGNDITFNDTVKIDALKGKTTAGSITVQGEGTATTNMQQGLAKQWCQFEGDATVSITNSFIVGSLTYTATGDYNLSYSNNMSDTGYSMTGGLEVTGTGKSIVAEPLVTNNIMSSGDITLDAAGGDVNILQADLIIPATKKLLYKSLFDSFA